MPSPSTPRRSSNRQSSRSTPSKVQAEETQKPLGVYDTNTVRDRIRHWQEQGGGVFSGSDVDTENADEIPSPSKSRRTNESPQIESPSARQGGRTEDSTEDVNRDRSRTPRKRVVSDEHWRKVRRASKTKTPVGGSATKASLSKDDGCLETPTRDVKSSRRRRRQESKKRSSDRHSGGKDFESPPSTRRKSENLSNDDTNLGQGRWSEDEEPVLRLSPSPPPQEDSPPRSRKVTTPEKISPKQTSKKEGSWQRRRSERKSDINDASPEVTPSLFSSSRRSGKARTVTRLSQVFDGGKAKSVKEDSSSASLTPGHRVPSVEAWLQGTPDPFVDEPEPEVEIPAPLKTHSVSRRLVAEDDKAEDPDQIWEILGSSSSRRRKSDGTGSRRKRRTRTSGTALEVAEPVSPSGGAYEKRTAKSSPTVEDIEREAGEASPAPLRRKGATRRHDSSSPGTKRGLSPLKESFSQEAEDSSKHDTKTPSESPAAFDQELFEFARPAPLNLRKSCPPTGGHQLSTIASVDTLRTSSEIQGSKDRDPSDFSLPYRAKHNPAPSNQALGGQGQRRHDAAPASESMHDVDQRQADAYERELPVDSAPGPGLKRRLTTHADLISVLSLPQTGRDQNSKSIRSARSIRTNRSRLATATIDDLMQELASDESKYTRELRTLVDGVIPVLLTCVLSKNDSSVAAGLFGSSGNASDDLTFTKPIVDMGIALERLKTLHKRIPQENPDRLLTWARGAQKVYTEYLKAWRLGFQDVVVNLAPADAHRPGSSASDKAPLDDGMPRDADGDVINGDGEKVDVAFLLKRPLVRLKYLSKTFKGIECIRPSPSAADISVQYQKLVEDARRRSNEERARLEDEAAANIDPTRARDLRTLAVLADMDVDKTRAVRARDYFNLTLHHSTGQRIDCRSELLLRDNRPDRGNGGDLLICEVDEVSGKWLLLPPLETDRISARNGDTRGEIVVMIRGTHGHEEEWHELLSLRTEDEETGFEWVQMLGLTPIPPMIERSQSFMSQRKTQLEPPSPNPSRPNTASVTLTKSRTPSPREIDVPIGEQASVISRSRRRPTTPKKYPQDTPFKNAPSPTPDQTPRSFKQHLSSWMGRKVEEPARPVSLPKSRGESPELRLSPQDIKSPLETSSDVSPSGLRRSKANRLSRHADEYPANPLPNRSTLSNPEADSASAPYATNAQKDASYERPQTERPRSKTSEPAYQANSADRLGNRGFSEPRPERPRYHRSKSSVPSLELPTIPKLRSGPTSASPLPSPAKEAPILASPKSEDTPRHSAKLQKKAPEKDARATPFTEDIPPPPPHRSSAPVPPPHRSPSPVQLKAARTPKLASPKVGSPTSANRGKRRSSSPLKHQYEPSSASDSSSESEESTIGRPDASSESDFSDEDELENGDVHTPLPPVGALRQFSKRTPPASLPTLPSVTLAPSNSASQAPYKTVPSQPTKSSRVIASIFTWSDKGCWESLHDDECSIVITPGLIEAYEMSASHSKRPAAAADQSSDLSSASQEEQPLVAVELTPLVPLRRGTALDISIRSPPTDKSKIKSSNNIMFRSRNPEECEGLYSLINQSRINNPTYIALQNARGPFSTHVPSVGRHSSVRHSRSASWFGLGAPRKGYRASSAPTPSIGGVSESSVGSMSSAFSALKRFGSNSKAFNISRSSVHSRNVSRPRSLYSSSSGSGTGSGSGSGTNTPAPNLGADGAIGLTNAKIRLYARETASKWRDMGAARLTISKPHPGMLPLRPPVGPGSSSSPSRLTGQEKRIVINSKANDQVLLDACLGESCFERVARTGIAVSVWEEMVGPNGEVGIVGAVGGVGGTRARVYMLQMKSEAETAYTFSLVGKLRY